MLILLIVHATQDQIKNASLDLNGYVKFVVDIDQQIMTIGGLRHFDGEQLLLQNGSHQKDLWGGGVDLESNEIDFESMINIRPSENPSREVLDQNLRKQIKKIVNKLFVKI